MICCSMNDNTKICTCDTMNLEAITHLWNYRPRKFRSDAFLFWSRGPDSYRKNDRKRAVVWPWLVLQLSTVLALTQLGIRQSDWRRAGIRSTNLHIVVECRITHCGRDKMAAVSQTTLSKAFSWMKIREFWFKFHWSLFLMVQLTIFHHWYR